MARTAAALEHTPARAGRDSHVIVLAFVAVLALVSPRHVQAQTPQVDPRWNAWVGCWTSSQTVSVNNTARAVCVVPAPGASAVDVATLGAPGAVSRERIQANGERRTSERDGCTGWETATWSADARRIYLQSEHQCTSGTKRTSRGLMAITAEGDWLDVVSVTMGENSGCGCCVIGHSPLCPLCLRTCRRRSPPCRPRAVRNPAPWHRRR